MLEKLNNVTTRSIIDGAVVAVAFFLAYQIRYDGNVPPFHIYQFWVLFFPLALGRLATSALFGLHRRKWRYVGATDAIKAAEAYAAFSLVPLLLRLTLPAKWTLFRVPIGVIAIEFMVSLLGAVGVRLLRAALYHRMGGKTAAPPGVRRMLLVGAGIHGVTVAKEMVLNKGMRVVGFVDDNPAKIGSLIAGVPVLGPVSALPQIVALHEVDEVLVCIPPADRARLNLIGSNGSLPVRTTVIPTVDEILEAETVSHGSSQEILLVNPRLDQTPKVGVAAPGSSVTSIRGKTILITGGAGFIGSSLAEKLAQNNQVILFDLSFRDKPVGFTQLPKHPNVRTVEGDLLEGAKLASLCLQAEMVVHAAAVVGVNRVRSSGRETLETNYVGTSRLLQALEHNKKLERLIYFSTSEVFGVNSFRVDENSPPSVGPIAEARWSYAIAKLAGEHLVKSYYREMGIPIVIVRPFNIFGPRRTGEHAMLRFILTALSSQPLQVHGDGSQIRSWCYIEDFCSALLAMLERPQAVGEDFNIGHPGNTITIYELARKIVTLSESKAPITFVEHPFPDISIRVPSLTKAQSLLGYRPTYDLDSALMLTIDWYRKHWSFFASSAAMAAGAR
jgi:nucleoside-diphosphate-sugar epimerase